MHHSNFPRVGSMSLSAEGATQYQGNTMPKFFKLFATLLLVNTLIAAAIFGSFTMWLSVDAMKEIGSFWHFVLWAPIATAGLALAVMASVVAAKILRQKGE